MKNNIIGFIAYLSASVIFSPSVGIILLAMKENADRCHYYDGKWNKTDLAIGISAIAIGMVIRYFILYILINHLDICLSDLFLLCL